MSLPRFDRWLPQYLATPGRRRPVRPGEPVHLILCVADHFEPKADGAPADVGRERVARWVREYPRQLGRFVDNDGRPPRHTFFFPEEEYEAEYLDALAGLCAAGFGEVEVHLHHDRDTADGLRAKLLAFKETLAVRHGLLSRRPTGEVVYGFVHGNWALNNCRADGRWCGVTGELRVLRETGCYADFTFPSAPAATQPRRINGLYWADAADPRRDAHERGPAVGSGTRPAEPLLMVQGPLLLNWNSRKWGLLPRTENGCLQPSQPPSVQRLPLWLKARVQVPSRPDWFFVKLHAHGATEDHAATLLGEPAVRFHEGLARLADADPNFHYHYVTAREMVNLVRAAEDGWRGGVADARDYEIVSNLTRSAPGGGGQPSRSPQGDRLPCC